MPKSVLSEFQIFLLSRQLVPEKKVSYYDGYVQHPQKSAGLSLWITFKI
ncbi:MAG: hypothetical protein ABII74_05155 [Elusimicrobiota bacterium]